MQYRRLRESDSSTGSLGAMFRRYSCICSLGLILCRAHLHITISISWCAKYAPASKIYTSPAYTSVPMLPSQRSPWMRHGLSTRPYSCSTPSSLDTTWETVRPAIASNSGHGVQFRWLISSAAWSSLAKEDQFSSQSTICGNLPCQVGMWKPNCPVGDTLDL